MSEVLWSYENKIELLTIRLHTMTGEESWQHLLYVLSLLFQGSLEVIQKSHKCVGGLPHWSPTVASRVKTSKGVNTFYRHSTSVMVLCSENNTLWESFFRHVGVQLCHRREAAFSNLTCSCEVNSPVDQNRVKREWLRWLIISILYLYWLWCTSTVLLRNSLNPIYTYLHFNCPLGKST